MVADQPHAGLRQVLGPVADQEVDVVDRLQALDPPGRGHDRHAQGQTLDHLQLGTAPPGERREHHVRQGEVLSRAGDRADEVDAGNPSQAGEVAVGTPAGQAQPGVRQ